MVESMRNTISIQLLHLSPDVSDKPLRTLMSFMSIFYKANLQSRIIKNEDFYIEVISQEFDPKEEMIKHLHNKMKGKNYLDFTNYPWLLEPAYKSLLIKEESDIEMSKEIKNDI